MIKLGNHGTLLGILLFLQRRNRAREEATDSCGGNLMEVRYFPTAYIFFFSLKNLQQLSFLVEGRAMRKAEFGVRKDVFKPQLYCS